MQYKQTIERRLNVWGTLEDLEQTGMQLETTMKEHTKNKTHTILHYKKLKLERK